MNPLDVLRDSFYFFQRNLSRIVTLCLPLVVLEALLQQLLGHAVEPDAFPGYSLIVELLVYPLYTGALILFLDARSRGESPATLDLLAMSVTLWPRLAVLVAINSMLLRVGLSLYFLPGVWLMVMLAFTEYLLVLRSLEPLDAIKQSFQLTKGHFLRILVCMLCVMVPLWVFKGTSVTVYAELQNPVLSLLMDSAYRFLQLFLSVVLYRLYMLICEKPDTPDSTA
ncbi:YciC family protein [Pseudomonas purpurea]|uniref:YciC family protein n=1 Tax=Pseudomonas purpurea TaxID=3136737 RepID=UPI003262E088